MGARRTYLQAWRAAHQAQGLCRRCNARAVDGRTKCQRHLDADLARYYVQQGKRPVRVREIITKAMLLHDLLAVSVRLGWRRITWTTYRREGSFYPSSKLRKRIGLSWSDLCVEAGLLKTGPGCKGIDQRPCQRCRKMCNYYGAGQCWCKTCRQTVRRRTTEPLSNWSITTTWQ